MQDLEQVRGQVRYEPDARAAFLQEDGFESLLAMDVPPFGHIQVNDIAAAFNHLRVFLGVEDGETVTLFGFRDEFGDQSLVLIVRIDGEEKE